MTRAVVFDLDGTLIDSAPDIHRCANLTLDEVGLPHVSLDQTLGFIGHGAPKFVEQMMDALGVSDGFDDILAQFLRHYEGPTTLTETYPGVMVVLDNLRTNGFALGLCTNKPIGPTKTVLEELGLTDFFTEIVGGDSLDQRKPDPTPLITILDRLKAKNSLYVGDSEVDAETADRAGVQFALFTKGYRKTPIEDLPHAIAFDDFAALPRIVSMLVG